MLEVAAGRITLFTPGSAGRAPGHSLCGSSYRLPDPGLRRAPCSALSGLSSPRALRFGERPRFLHGPGEYTRTTGPMLRSAVSRQPSAVSRQPSAVSRQPSAVSCQPSWPMAEVYFSIMRLSMGMSPSVCFWRARMLTCAAIALATDSNALASIESGWVITTG